MAITGYVAIDNAFSAYGAWPLADAANPQTGLAAKMVTAIGLYCYGALTESAATADHAARVAFVEGIFVMTVSTGGSGATTARPYPRLARTVFAALGAMGAVDATADATVQTYVNTILENIRVAGV